MTTETSSLHEGSFIPGVPAVEPIKFNTEAAITRILDNSLQDLENLRSEADRLGLKNIDDVRPIRYTEVLRGIEEPISYPDLLSLISDLKNGIARRRLELGAGDVAA